MPGAPSSASTTNPESSANAGSFAACAAATALICALARKLSPVSSGSPRPSSPADTASTPCGASSSRISTSLPGLWVAITSLPVIRRCMRNPTPAVSFAKRRDKGKDESPHRHFLQVHQTRDAFSRQRHQRQKLAFRERRLFGRALNLDDAAVAGHHEIGVGIGLGILGVIEIEYRRAVADAAGNRRDIVAQHIAGAGLEHIAGF